VATTSSRTKKIKSRPNLEWGGIGGMVLKVLSDMVGKAEDNKEPKWICSKHPESQGLGEEVPGLQAKGRLVTLEGKIRTEEAGKGGVLEALK